VAPERQSNIDAHIRSRIQAELEHLRKEEEHVRREIESTLEKENLDRERAMAGIPESEATVGTLNSSTALSEDLEHIRSKIDRYHPRKRLELFPQVKSAGKTVLSCYK
jgi:altered-inheritance-of-mitochondria protein 13